MHTFQLIYQWGGLFFVVLGVVFAIVGVVREDCPLLGHSTFSDSVVNRMIHGVGIAMVWPVFIPIVLLASLLSLLQRSRLSGSPKSTNQPRR